MPCYFTNAFMDDDCVYQACSCGEHVWSTKAKKVIILNGRTSIKTRRKGQPVVVPLTQPCPKSSSLLIISALVSPFLITMLFFVTCHYYTVLQSQINTFYNEDP
jgi:hypothetical protein